MRAACLDLQTACKAANIGIFRRGFSGLYGLLLCKSAGLDYNRDR